MLGLSGLTLGIFLLIGLGALSRRFGLLKYEDRNALNNIIIFISLPALIFTAARRAPFSPSLLTISAMAMALSLTGIAIGYGLAKLLRLKGPLFGAFLLTSGIGNTGYLGYPLTQALFGRAQLVKAVFYDIFGTVFVLFTVGIYFASKYGRGTQKAWRQGLTLAAPNLIALALGFAAYGTRLPVPIDLAINSLAASTVAVIMLSIGISLSSGVDRSRAAVGAITVLKLALMPALAFALGAALHLPPIVRGVTLLQASMPIALMSFVIGDKYDLDRDFLSGAILVSTLLSLVTIPLWQSVAQLLK
ncbi:MAG: AEC family transporter [Actinomycetota bacterium]|nr:AEC family transporter [Actinomycetota bacterium]